MRNKRLEAEAAVFGYRRIGFPRDWTITMRTPARKLMQNAAALARMEGNINHALSLEARLPDLPKNSRYQIGRLKNGCSTGEVVIRR